MNLYVDALLFCGAITTDDVRGSTSGSTSTSTSANTPHQISWSSLFSLLGSIFRCCLPHCFSSLPSVHVRVQHLCTPGYVHADRILQLVCVQTKPVQIYRITAGDALPPSDVLLLDNDLDSSVVVVDDGSNGVDAAASGNLPGAMSPSELDRESTKAELEELEAEAEAARDDSDGAVEVTDLVVDDGKKESRVGVGVGGGGGGGDVDSIALSKEGGGGGEGAGVGGESAPSFEKVRKEEEIKTTTRGGKLPRKKRRGKQRTGNQQLVEKGREAVGGCGHVASGCHDRC